ncbi:MAG: hypothetical protein M3Z98_09255 [Candidatus Dormibacteraeota bacterium]|nr:hypothetical protein [Candidatus Dormibacteraeota bacterium]
MPLLGGLFHKGDGGPVVIPVAAQVPVAFRVYYTPGYPPLLPEDLRAKAVAWVENHVEEPLRSALRPVVGSPALSYADMAKTAFPPPLDLLQHSDVGDEERGRLERAWQVLVVSCDARPQVPMFGLWAAIAAARSAALELSGALFDAPAVRLTEIASYQQGLPRTGVLNVTDHVAFPADSDPSGLIRWHTTGMNKFGLPEIVIPAPAGVDQGSPLRALAQHLLDSLLRANHGRPELLTELVVPADPSLPQATGPASLRLQLVPGQTGVPTLVALPPT